MKNTWSVLFTICLGLFILSSCKDNCETVSISFENQYSDRTLTLVIDGRERATLEPREKITLNLDTGFHTREFRGGCAEGSMDLECGDDGIEYFCPG
ncbi:MAG: hypothetical protein AAGC47_12960 [Bacteroidota bacterium]